MLPTNNFSNITENILSLHIQNSVLDIYRIFQFALKGYLGTEVSFKRRYLRPIQRAKQKNCTEEEKKKGNIRLHGI